MSEGLRDPVIRRAARVAALTAVPVALVAGFIVYRVLDNADSPGAAGGAGTPARPHSTAAVPMPARPLPPRPAEVCRTLSTRLPDRIGDLDRRPVTAAPDQNAAYGDPPVTLACGAPGPPVPTGAPFLEINGICWYAEKGPDAASWSLRGHEVSLVVTVPPRHTGQLLADLAKPISDAIPATGVGCA
jgi:hypothetical protein